MKLLLTSNGICNDTLAKELETLAGKKFDELKIGFIPSAAFGNPSDDKSWLIDDLYRLRSRGARVAIISLADLTKEEIQQQLEPVDVVFFGGGKPFYLSWLLQQKGMFEWLPKLLDTKVYAGISAGTMLASVTLRLYSGAIQQSTINDEAYEKLGPTGRSNSRTFNFVPFAVRPHLNTHLVKEIDEGALEKIANKTKLTIYAIDDNCAMSVDGDKVKVVGEGAWKIIKPEEHQS